MKHDFSKFFKNNKEELNDYIKQYTSYLNILDENDNSIAHLKRYYYNIFDAFSNRFEEEKIFELFEELANYKISIDLPYIIINSELNSLKNILLTKMIKENTTSNIEELLSLFSSINNHIANIYLKKYISTLLSSNNVRISSLSDVLDKNIIGHYESHLIWLTDLAKCILNETKEDFPELNDKLCSFGLWLHDEAKQIIQNNSKFKSIDALHQNLHFFGRKINSYIGSNEYHLLITYLEKCELISLGIGTELALIDNILMNKKITKDPLTNSLNRQALKSVFESQYELSLATSNPFVLAMCDLDDFKHINDTHGHIVGDRMLKLFIDTVKQHLRNSDIVIRYGGEEFVIMLPAIKKDKGLKVVEEIRQSFQDTSLDLDGVSVKTTVSIGLIEINPEYTYKPNYLNEYISIADQKLYLAKKNGKNRIEIH